jgi:membrane protease subunit HflC
MAISPFIVWQVTDVKRYLAGQASMQPQDTRQLVVERLSDQVSEALSKALAGQNLSALVTADHTDILEKVAHQVSSDMEKQVGVAVRKIGLLDVNWPESGRSTVYARMKADFASRVDAIVASGKAKAAETRAETDAQSTLLLAAAYRNSQKTRADGDAKASAIYAAAYGKNPEFYRFYRSLKAYRNSFGSGDLLVLSPDSDFFRYFRKAN